MADEPGASGGIQDPGGDPGPGAAEDVTPEWLGGLPETERHESLHKFKPGDGEELVPMPAAIAKSYVALEGKIGADPLVMPEEGAPQDQWDTFYNKIGRPDAPTGYELPLPEEIPPEAIDPAIETSFRETAHTLGLTAAQAKGLNDWVNGLVVADVERGKESIKEEETNFNAALRKDYGADAEKMRVLGLRAAKLYGGEALFNEIQEKGLSFSMPIMKAFITMGKATSETSLKGVDVAGVAEKKLTRVQLEKMMDDPRYSGVNKDPEYVKMVTDGFKTLYPDQVPAAAGGPTGT